MNLQKRRRENSIWTGLVCFLIHSYDEGTLEEMGLKLSEGLCDSIMDVTEAVVWHGGIGQSPNRTRSPLEDAVEELLMELITDPKVTFQTNPLLWWVGILVQSSLSTGRDDYISRGRFNINILPMDVDIRGRLEALLHYCQVFVLHCTMQTWKISAVQMDEVRGSMATIDLEWLNADNDQRPAPSADTRNCQSVAWKDLVKHLRVQSKSFLGEKPRTVGKQLRLLLEESTSVN